jgi:hypothetical protein
MVEDFLTSIGRKRSRGGDETSEGTPRTQRRRSMRNPRIGSGFHNQPEDPVIINEEGNVAQVGSGEGDSNGGVSLVGVQTGSFAPYHDGRLVPDSVCTLDTLAKLREEYKIPDYVTLSSSQEL